MGGVVVARVGEQVPCRVVRRVNRFVVEVEAPWGRDRAHLNNTGRLLDVLVPGRRGYCTRTRGARLRLRLSAVEYHGGYALIDTRLQELAFAEIAGRGLVAWGGGPCRVLARGPRVEGRRLDFLLECPRGRVLVETKSAVLAGPGGVGLYPDCPTVRGREHIRLLSLLARRGVGVWLVFVVAFPGARGFAPNREGDPEVPVLVREAVESGVLVGAVGLYYDPGSRGVVFYGELPVLL